MNQNLNEKQAYLAMFSFLEDYYNRTKSDDIGSMLGAMCLTNDGMPMDAAYWHEWQLAVQKSLNGLVDAEMRLSGGDDQSS